MQNKEVEIFNFRKSYEVGQQVTVLFRESKGFTALFFGYVLPFLLVLLTLVISVEITKELKDFEPPRVSREKVEEIKRALKEGRYTVNPHRISEAIVREILGD